MPPEPDAFPSPQPPSDPLAGLNLKGALEAGIQPDQWEPPAPAELAAVLPDYQITMILGRGGMGAIYKARDPELDRTVAIKLLPPELGTLPDLVERFTREARALARLDHPNIVRIYDFGRTTAGHLYFVMEYVDGLDLGRILRSREQEGPPKEHSATLEIISQICDALNYAHSKGIIHRDIKPGNVLLSKEGRVKVADFGLARAIDPLDGSTGLKEKEAVTLSGMVVGTLEYMAPEQQEGQKVDHRADIYSVGVLFYQMLTGQLPRGAFRPPSRKASSVDARLDKVVLRALQSEPVERYQQASDLRDAVQALVKLKSPPAAPRPPARPALTAEAAPGPKPWNKTRLRRAGSALSALALTGLVVYSLSRRKEELARPDHFPDLLVLREAIPAAMKVSDGIYEVDLPPDGHLPLTAFYQVRGEPLNLTFSAPGYQPHTLSLQPGQDPPGVRLEAVTASFTWQSDPAGWFSAARLVRQNPPADPRAEPILELTPGNRKIPAGSYALSGLWGDRAIPLDSLTLSSLGRETRLKWPFPARLNWTGVVDLNPQPVLIGMTSLYQKVAASWSVPVAVPFLLDFQPGGTAVLYSLNPQIMQVALLALMGGSLPEEKLEDEAAVHALFQNKVIHPLTSRNTPLGPWFSALWKEQSRTPLAKNGDARRAAVFAQFRDQAAFLTNILNTGDPTAALQDPRYRQFVSFFFDVTPLRAEPGEGPLLKLTNASRTLSLSTAGNGSPAEFLTEGKPAVVLKSR